MCVLNYNDESELGVHFDVRVNKKRRRKIFSDRFWCLVYNFIDKMVFKMELRKKRGFR